MLNDCSFHLPQTVCSLKVCLPNSSIKATMPFGFWRHRRQFIVLIPSSFCAASFVSTRNQMGFKTRFLELAADVLQRSPLAVESLIIKSWTPKIFEPHEILEFFQNLNTNKERCKSYLTRTFNSKEEEPAITGRLSIDWRRIMLSKDHWVFVVFSLILAEYLVTIHQFIHIITSLT